jgi:hypothetical protein
VILGIREREGVLAGNVGLAEAGRELVEIEVVPLGRQLRHVGRSVLEDRAQRGSVPSLRLELGDPGLGAPELGEKLLIRARLLLDHERSYRAGGGA